MSSEWDHSRFSTNIFLVYLIYLWILNYFSEWGPILINNRRNVILYSAIFFWYKPSALVWNYFSEESSILIQNRRNVIIVFSKTIFLVYLVHGSEAISWMTGLHRHNPKSSKRYSFLAKWFLWLYLVQASETIFLTWLGSMSTQIRQDAIRFYEATWRFGYIPSPSGSTTIFHHDWVPCITKNRRDAILSYGATWLFGIPSPSGCTPTLLSISSIQPFFRAHSYRARTDERDLLKRLGKPLRLSEYRHAPRLPHAASCVGHLLHQQPLGLLLLWPSCKIVIFAFSLISAS